MNGSDGPRELASLLVRQRGSLEATGELFEPYRLIGPDGVPVSAAAAYFAELTACGRPSTTLRSYGMDLLRWFRFLWAVDVGWDRATRVEARDFCCWLQVATKPVRAHWRRPDAEAARRAGRPQLGRPNPVTGKPSVGSGYAAATAAHAETVLRAFYDFHLEGGSGPMVNPFPVAPGPSRRPGARPPQPDGPVRSRAAGTLPGRSW